MRLIERYSYFLKTRDCAKILFRRLYYVNTCSNDEAVELLKLCLKCTDKILKERPIHDMEYTYKTIKGGIIKFYITPEIVKKLLKEIYGESSIYLSYVKRIVKERKKQNTIIFNDIYDQEYFNDDSYCKVLSTQRPGTKEFRHAKSKDPRYK